MRPTSRHLPDLLLLLTALIWGAGFVFTNQAVLSGMPLSLLLALRFLIPAAIMAVLFRRELAVAPSEDFRFGAVAGIILFVAFLTQTYGIKYTTPANNAFLTTTNVVMVPFISWAVLKKRPGLSAVGLALLCFVGMAVLSWSPGIGLTLNLGDCLTLLCAFGFACHIGYLGLSGQRSVSAAVLSFTQLGVAGLLSALVFLLFDRKAFTLASLRAGLIPVLFLGLFSTGLCFFLQSWAQRRISPTRAAILLSTEGLFGSAFSVLCGYDALTLNLVVGGGIILCSVMLIQLDLSALLRRLGIQRPAANAAPPSEYRK